MCYLQWWLKFISVISNTLRWYCIQLNYSSFCTSSHFLEKDWPGNHKNFMHMIQHGIVEDDSNRFPWETVRVCAKPIYGS